MGARNDGETVNGTTARRSDTELILTRSFNAPARLVFEAWTKPELFKRWWAPKSSGMAIVSCTMDVRVGGGYSLTFSHPKADKPFTFFGKYLEVVPASRLVWTNEESEGGAISTVVLTEKGGKTELVFSERYPTKEALDQSYEGMESGMPEQFGQLDELLAVLQ
ncbi:MAG: SRPBCC family protein [Aestuariivirga sp.]